MSCEVKTSWGARIFNPELGGAIATGKNIKKRIQGALDLLRPEEETLDQGETTDWYRNGKPVVSMETAAAREFGMKDALDDAVLDENLYPSEPGSVARKQTPPCKLLRSRRWS